MKHRFQLSFLALAALFLLPQTASAHPGHLGHDLTGGLVHPLTGIDHLLVMLAVGILGATLGGKSIFLLPITFVAAMAGGGLIAAAAVNLPLVETYIALSVVVSGVVLAARWQPALWLAAVVIGGFGIFHGYAHVAETPMDTTVLVYMAGMLTSTAILHVTGVMIGLWILSRRATWVSQVCGAAVAIVGLLLVAGVM